MFFAFIMMGPFGKDDRAMIKGENAVIGISSLDEAVEEAKRLESEGCRAIELCGAFGENGARRIIEATGHRIAVGYVTHFPEDDPIFKEVWG